MEIARQLLFTLELLTQHKAIRPNSPFVEAVLAVLDGIGREGIPGGLLPTSPSTKRERELSDILQYSLDVRVPAAK